MIYAIVVEIVNPNDNSEVGGYRWKVEADDFVTVSKAAYDDRSKCRAALNDYLIKWKLANLSEVKSQEDTMYNFDFLL